MKKNLLTLFIFISILTNISFAQIPSTEDSVKSLLCKKWEIDYALMTGMKITKGMGAPDIFFEFKPDHTFLETSSVEKKNETGSWSVDLTKKLVSLQHEGKSKIIISSITPVELQMRLLPQNESEKDLEQMQLVLKLRDQ